MATVLYDLGALVRDDLRPQSKAIAESLGRDEVPVDNAIEASADRYAEGEITQGQHWEQIALRLGLPDTDTLAAYAENTAEVDKELLGRVRAQSPAHVMGLVSDATPDWVGEFRKEHQLDQLFRAHIIDSELAGSHTYRQLLELAAKRLQAAPPEVFFVDRRQAHLKAAADASMRLIDLNVSPNYQVAFAVLP